MIYVCFAHFPPFLQKYLANQAEILHSPLSRYPAARKAGKGVCGMGD